MQLGSEQSERRWTHSGRWRSRLLRRLSWGRSAMLWRRLWRLRRRRRRRLRGVGDGVGDGTTADGATVGVGRPSVVRPQDPMASASASDPPLVRAGMTIFCLSALIQMASAPAKATTITPATRPARTRSFGMPSDPSSVALGPPRVRHPERDPRLGQRSGLLHRVEHRGPRRALSLSPRPGVFYHLYLMVDVWSRKVVFRGRGCRTTIRTQRLCFGRRSIGQTSRIPALRASSTWVVALCAATARSTSTVVFAS